MRSTHWNWKQFLFLTVLAVGMLVIAACDTGGDEGPFEGGEEGTVTEVAPAGDTTDTGGDTTGTGGDTQATPTEAADVTATETMTDTSGTDTDSAGTDAGATGTMTETETTTDTGATGAMTDTAAAGDTGAGATGSMTDTTAAGATGSMTDTTAAGDTGTDATGTMTDTTAAGDTGAVAAGDAGAMTSVPGVSGAEGVLVRGSLLLDYNFENRDGAVSGDLEDMLVDASTGNILFTTLEYGGVLDLGDKDIVVPLSAFTVGNNGNLVLNFDEQTLEALPDVGNDWPDVANPAWDDEVTTFWRDNDFDPGFNFDETNTTGVVWMSELTGDEINGLGDNVGMIEDVLIDMGASRIAYVLFNFGAGGDAGAAGGEGSYLLPFEALQMQRTEDGQMSFASSIDPETLATAPRYDTALYPDDEGVPQDFITEVDAFWAEQGFEMD